MEREICPYCKVRPISQKRKTAKTCWDRDCVTKHNRQRSNIYLNNRYKNDDGYRERVKANTRRRYKKLKGEK